MSIALVTGANRGIGYEICRQLASSGIKTILTSRNEDQGKVAAQKLQSAGLDVLSYQLDVADPQSITKLKNDIEKEIGALDILINNAGVLIDKEATVSNVSLDTIKTTLDCNTIGPWLIIQAFIPLLKKSGQGRIINVSSKGGQMENMHHTLSSYRISKLSLNSLTRIFADELSEFNIPVNAASPGHVKTDMGGENATRSIDQGADTMVWLATKADSSITGKFFEDRKEISW